MPRPKPAKTADNTAQKVGSHHHLMPGLIDPLCDAFDHPKKHLTTRGVAREQGVAETFVTSALIRDTRREISELRGMMLRLVNRQPDNVREFRIFNGGQAA